MFGNVGSVFFDVKCNFHLFIVWTKNNVSKFNCSLTGYFSSGGQNLTKNYIMSVIRNSLSFKQLRDPVLYGFVHQKRSISTNGVKSVTTPLLILRLIMYDLAYVINWCIFWPNLNTHSDPI